jgi:hypothetical protein
LIGEEEHFMATNAPSPTILDLDDLTDQPMVVIDAKRYPLRAIGQLTPLEVHRHVRMGRRLDDLSTRPDLTPDEEAELERLPGQICRSILEAPDDVHAGLKDWQRMKIIGVFMQLSMPSRPNVESLSAAVVQTPTSMLALPIGATSSPDSPGSTEATPSAG